MMAPLLFLLASTAAAHVVPLVDHHQHLLSPAAAALVNRTLPAVELPPDLAALLKQRLARWNDKAGLAELYTDDAVALSTESPGWLRGKTAVADYLGARFGHAYGIRPAAWSMSGSAARIAGYLTPAGDPSASFGYVYLDLRKVGEQWRIAGETPVRAGPGEAPLDAAGLVAMLDAAGIRRAVVLSNAYYFDD